MSRLSALKALFVNSSTAVGKVASLFPLSADRLKTQTNQTRSYFFLKGVNKKPLGLFKPSFTVLLFFFLSLSEVHPKKVRKVPPGLPSSVSDNMPFFHVLFGRFYCCFKCVSEEKAADAPACLEALSWLT